MPVSRTGNGPSLETKAVLTEPRKAEAQPGTGPGLERALGPSAAAAIVLGTMIGTGIFLKPSEVAADAGSTAVVAAAWVAAGILSLFGGLCYAELGASIPEAGGEYAYLRRGFGNKSAFLFGWMHSIIARPASVAAIAAGFLRFCGFFYPALYMPLYVLRPLPGVSAATFTFTWAQPLAVAALIVMTAINFLGVRLGGQVQVVLTALKVGSVLLIIACVFLLIRQPHVAMNFHPLWPSSITWGTLEGFLTALAAAAWAYDGWNDLNLVGSEVEDPQRNFPRVIVRGVLFVLVVFLVFNFACFYALPYPAVAGSRHVASDLFSRVAGRDAALWITFAMAISALGTLNSSILSGARVDYAIARDGIFFRFAAAVHPKYRTPGNALILQCAIASVMALSGTFEDLTSLVMFGSWTFYALAVLSMVRMRKKYPAMPRPYRTWGYPVTPVLFVIGAFALALSLWVARPIRSTIGFVLVISGLFFYRYWTRKDSHATDIRLD
jgi:APA family basic amino acid/polyamine antiporter